MTTQLLGLSSSHVAKDREKIKSGKALSPILLVRDSGRLIIADGYHRMCAVYAEGEDADIRAGLCELLTSIC